eukprot:XP_001698888.1 fasciclin-like protein [Chlamydomonas reinhardtii]
MATLRRAALLLVALFAAVSVVNAQEAAQKRNPANTAASTGSGPAVDIAIQALNATGVSGKLNASTVATIFAPDDAAFISLASSLNFTSREQVFASPFATNTVNASSLLGPTLEVTRNGNAVRVAVAGNPNSSAEVIKADIPFNAAIVHVINKVLLPPSTTAPAAAASPSPVTAAPSPIILAPVPGGTANETTVGGGGNYTGGAYNTTNATTGATQTKYAIYKPSNAKEGKVASSRAACMLLGALLGSLLLLAPPAAGSTLQQPEAQVPPRVAGARRALRQLGTLNRPLTLGYGATIAIDALNATGVSNFIGNDTIATIFAPEDNAFIRLAPILNITTRWQLFTHPLAANITELHIIPGVALRSLDIPLDTTLNETSLLGPTLEITRSGRRAIRVKVAGTNMTADVVRADIRFESSIVHIIDNVLLPPP